RDRMHVRSLLTRRVHGFTEAEREVVLIRLDVANVLAILRIKGKPPTNDGLQRRRALPDDIVQAFGDLPILHGSTVQFGENRCVTFFCEHMYRSPLLLSPNDGSFANAPAPDVTV